MATKEELSTIENIDMDKGVDPAAQCDFTPEEERQVLRKIDRVVLPLMALVYFFQCKPKAHRYPLIHRLTWER